MKDKEKPQRDWIDIALKALTPVLAGLLIAWAGFVGNIMLTKVSNRQESARLITELQIKREQAESELRKDIFDQALEAFLLKKPDATGTLKDVSKQMLRLELLALNFGDSLSLSPLFAEFTTDLDQSRPINEEEKRNYKEQKAKLRKRLNSLAKRVASTQLSSLVQHGASKNIEIQLYGYKELVESEDEPCKKVLFEDRDFVWPTSDIQKQLGILNNEYRQIVKDEEIPEIEEMADVRDLIKKQSLIELAGVKRYLQANITHIDHCKKTAKVQIILIKDDQDNPEVNRTFNLDYFNFPMVDNTRLSENQRFAIVMEAFDLKREPPTIEITGVVFPSEYASLRDRPGMQEARKLLESALENGDKK